jgi:hypothetical protein
MTLTTAVVIAIRPIFAMIVFAAIIYPLKRLAWKLIPPGKIKDFLFREI